MTIDEALNELNDVVEDQKYDKGVHQLSTGLVKAIRVVIEELKQEPVLDRIRAEIYLKQYDFMTDKDYDEGIRFGLMLAHQIIDKYKTESEKV